MSTSDTTAVNAANGKKENTYPISLEQQQLYAAKKNPDYKVEFNDKSYWVGTDAGKDSTNEGLFKRIVDDFDRGVIYGTRYPAIVDAKEINKKIQKILDETRDLGMLQHKQNREQQDITQARIDALQVELIALNDELSSFSQTLVTVQELLEGELGLTSEQALSYARSMQQGLLYYHRYLTNYRGEPEFSAAVCREGDKLIIKLHTETDPELYSEFEILVSDLKVDAEGKPKVAPIRMVETRALVSDLKSFISFYGLENLLNEEELRVKIESMKSEDELEQFWCFCTSLGNAVAANLMSREKLREYFFNFHPVKQFQNLQAPDLKTVFLCLEQIDAMDRNAVFNFIKNFLNPYIIKHLDEFKKTLCWLDVLEIQAKREGLARPRPEMMETIAKLNLKYHEDIVVTLTPEGQYAYRFEHMTSFLTALQDVAFSHGRDSLKEVENASVLSEDNPLINRPQDPLSKLYNEALTRPTGAVVSIQEIIWATKNLTEDEFAQFEAGLSEFSKRYYDDFEFKQEFKNFPGGPNAWRKEAELHRDAVKLKYRNKFLKFDFFTAMGADKTKQLKEQVNLARSILQKYNQLVKKKEEIAQEGEKLTEISKMLDIQANKALSRRDTALLGIAAVFTVGLALIPFAIIKYSGINERNKRRQEIHKREQEIVHELPKINAEMKDIKGDACRQNPYITCTDTELRDILLSVNNRVGEDKPVSTVSLSSNELSKKFAAKKVKNFIQSPEGILSIILNKMPSVFLPIITEFFSSSTALGKKGGENLVKSPSVAISSSGSPAVAAVITEGIHRSSRAGAAPAETSQSRSRFSFLSMGQNLAGISATVPVDPIQGVQNVISTISSPGGKAGGR